MNFEYLESSLVGRVRIEADDIGLTRVSLVNDTVDEVLPNLHTNAAKQQLEKYFLGELTSFDLSYNLTSGPPFYRKVWKVLMKIPYGRTITYLDIAKELGDPKSTRAVGMANGKNPIAIIIPCHRVIGSDRSLTGYAYGTAIKQRLLALENPVEYAVNGLLF